MSGVDRQAVSVHQDALMTFSEVQRPETPTDVSTHTQTDRFNINPLLSDGGNPVPQSGPESQETLELKLLWQGRD